MSLRHEFVTQATAEGAHIAQLCAQFGISRKTGYKWLARYRAEGEAGLVDRSRRPKTSPHRTPAAVEACVLAERAAHPVWGGRKVRARLLAQAPLPPVPTLSPPTGCGDAGDVPSVPAPRGWPSASTITALVRRAGLPLVSPRANQPRAYQRFAAAAPNQLWQMDFKGHVPLQTPGVRCHPLTVLDDHSRFAVGLVACANEQATTVQQALTRIFTCYGLPDRMLMDNGSPWGGSEDAAHRWTALAVWLFQLGVTVSHGRPYHPQTQGKDERFHRTLKAELLTQPRFQQCADCPEAQPVLEAWRTEYNTIRPHAALQETPPASRYQPSTRPFPPVLPPLVYPPTDQVRLVQTGGLITVRQRAYYVGKAFVGTSVGLRPTTTTGLWQVYFSTQAVAWVDERLPIPPPPC